MRRPEVVSLLIVLVLLGAWEAACRGLTLPDYILPAPSAVLQVAVMRAALLGPHALVTAAEILAGILLALAVALPLSVAMFAHPVLERALAPFLVASQAVPVFAVAPLLVVWLGYGMASKIFMAAVIIFFPITVSLLQGFKDCDRDYRVLFYPHGGRIFPGPAPPLLAVGHCPGSSPGSRWASRWPPSAR